MSFILDALKKSENERQRQSGPALFEVKVAQPAARFPIWAVAIGLLLGINLVVLIVVMLMRDARGKADAAPNTAASAMTAAAAPSTAVVPGPTPLAPLPATVPPTGSGPGPANNAPPNSAYNPPLVQDPTLGDGEAMSSTYTPRDYQPAEGPDPANAANGAYAANGTNAGGLSPAGTASTPIGGAAGPAGPRLSAAQRTGLPSRDDLVTAGNTQIPEVTLSLHVFDKIPANRFVFVNSQRAREGDSLPSGLKIEEITAEGAVLSFRGSRFLVPL